jgi:hypothetical protein
MSILLVKLRLQSVVNGEPGFALCYIRADKAEIARSQAEQLVSINGWYVTECDGVFVAEATARESKWLEAAARDGACLVIATVDEASPPMHS